MKFYLLLFTQLIQLVFSIISLFHASTLFSNSTIFKICMMYFLQFYKDIISSLIIRNLHYASIGVFCFSQAFQLLFINSKQQLNWNMYVCYYIVDCNMTLTSPWTLVVKQDSVTGVHAIGFSVVDYYPVGVQLGHTWNIKQTDIQVTMYPSTWYVHNPYQVPNINILQMGCSQIQ